MSEENIIDGICIYYKKILSDISKHFCEDCENKIKGETIMSDGLEPKEYEEVE